MPKIEIQVHYFSLKYNRTSLNKNQIVNFINLPNELTSSNQNFYKIQQNINYEFMTQTLQIKN